MHVAPTIALLFRPAVISQKNCGAPSTPFFLGFHHPPSHHTLILLFLLLLFLPSSLTRLLNFLLHSLLNHLLILIFLLQSPLQFCLTFRLLLQLRLDSSSLIHPMLLVLLISSLLLSLNHALIPSFILLPPLLTYL